MVLVIVPSLILWLGEGRTIFTILNSNIILLVIGFIVLGMGLLLWLDCVVLFYKIGKGTLFPSKKIETKSLIIVGPYKYVRNPMITGVVIALLGESVLSGSLWLFAWCVFFFAGNHVYFIFSEEPGLVKRFGDEFLVYKRNVPRWIPRLTPWNGK